VLIAGHAIQFPDVDASIAIQPLPMRDVEKVLNTMGPEIFIATEKGTLETCGHSTTQGYAKRYSDSGSYRPIYHLNAKLDEVFEQWKSKNRINKMANDSCVNIYLTFLLNVQKFFMMS
jgi:hypothetical protein